MELDTKEITREQLEALHMLIEYVYNDERDDYQAQSEEMQSLHIFNYIWTLKELLEDNGMPLHV